MEDIFKKLKVDFEFATGWVYKGLAQALGAGFASRLKEFDDKLEFIKKNAFIATADKDYLYLNASNMIPPKPAEIAKGLVVFYGEVGSVIPASTEIKDDNGVFKVVNDVTISETVLNGTATVTDNVATISVPNELTSTTAVVNGTSKQITIIDRSTIQFDADGMQTGDEVEIKVKNALASVVALEVGSAGNRALNDVLKLKITIAGVNTELGALQISGGVDDEDVEAYRQRVMFFMSNPQAPFSKQNIIATNIERIKTLKYVWVKGGEIEDGKVKVIGLNKDFSITDYELNEILLNTRAIKPVQLTDEAITATTPIIENVEVWIKDLIPASDGLQEEIRKNIKYFFDGDMYEKTITKSNLEAVIYKTTNGAEEVESFELINGWKTSTENTFWMLNNVIFQ